MNQMQQPGNQIHSTSESLLVHCGESSADILPVIPEIMLRIDHEKKLSHAVSGQSHVEAKEKADNNHRHIEIIQGSLLATAALLHEQELEQALNHCLRCLGKSYHTDHLAIFQFVSDSDPPEITMNLICEWNKRKPIDYKNHMILQKIPIWNGYDGFYEALTHDQHVIALTRDLSGSPKEFLLKQGIRSILILAVFVRNQCWGFIGMAECVKERLWTAEEIYAFKTIAIVIGSVISRFHEQEELTIAKLRAEETDRLKSSLMANMNHEVRTPMTGILGFSEILYQELESPNHRMMAQNILTSGKRLLTTLNSIIDLSQFEAKKTLSNLKEAKLNEILLLASETYIKAAKSKNLSFEIRMNESVYSYIDEKLFKQLLHHLLDNAVKFTSVGKITVETRNEWMLDKVWSCISITDTGPGIPSDFHTIIFEDFRQVSEGYSRKFEGSGLGLSLAKKIVELMNGKITLISKPGQGASFTIWLPSSQIKGTGSLKPDHVIDYRPDLHKYTETKRQKNLPDILVVEDNRLNYELIQIYLRDICNIDIARTGERAIEMATFKKYHAIVMDINLGHGMNGLQASKEIRKLESYQGIPIIAVTGYTMDSDKERIIEAGCTHYLPKPIEKSSFTNLVKELIRKT